MPAEGSIHDEIPARMASILHLVAREYTQGDIAAQLGWSRHTVRSEIERAKAITGCSDQRAPGRWWQDGNDIGWALRALERVGVDPRRLVDAKGESA